MWPPTPASSLQYSSCIIAKNTLGTIIPLVLSISTTFMYEGVMRGSCYLEVEGGPENISSLFYVKGTAIWSHKLSDHHLVILNLYLIHPLSYDHLLIGRYDVVYLVTSLLQVMCIHYINYYDGSILALLCIVIERYGPAGLVFFLSFTSLILTCFHVGGWYLCAYTHMSHAKSASHPVCAYTFPK